MKYLSIYVFVTYLWNVMGLGGRWARGRWLDSTCRRVEN